MMIGGGRANEIIWVYQKAVRRAVNSIPAGKAYSIMSNDASGRSIEVKGCRSERESASL